jgi:hypothetical protein
MKKIPQHLEDRLLDYLDNKLSASERDDIETMSRHDKDLRTRLEELRALHTILGQTRLEHPASNFTHKVMTNLYQKPIRSLSIRNGLLLLTGVLITIGITLAFASSGFFDNASAAIDLNKYNLPNKYIEKTLPTFSLDGGLLVNIVVILNMVLVFVLLDRVILKPFFRRRMEAGH